MRTTRGEVTRQHLLDSAERSFAALGYEGSSLGRIAESIGMTTGAIYQHFPGKFSLFEALHHEYRIRLEQCLGATVPLEQMFASHIRLNRSFRGTLRASDDLLRVGSHASAAIESNRSSAAAVLGDALRNTEELSDSRRRSLGLDEPSNSIPLTARIIVDAISYFSLGERHLWWSPRTAEEVAGTLSVMCSQGLFTAPSSEAGTSAPLTVLGPLRRNRDTRILQWHPAPGRKAPSTKRGAVTFMKIREAANMVFSERGLSNVSVHDIAGEAGVSAATVYQYFSSKEDLFRSLQASVEDELYSTSIYPADELGRLDVADTYRNALGAYRRNSGVYRAWRELLEPSSENDSNWKAMFGGFLERLTHLFELGQHNGVVPTHLHPGVAAELFSSFIQEPMFTHVLFRWYGDHSDADLAMAVDRLVRGDRVHVGAPT
jgi:AcrR family transcriptional regulator